MNVGDVVRFEWVPSDPDYRWRVEAIDLMTLQVEIGGNWYPMEKVVLR